MTTLAVKRKQWLEQIEKEIDLMSENMDTLSELIENPPGKFPKFATISDLQHQWTIHRGLRQEQRLFQLAVDYSQGLWEHVTDVKQKLSEKREACEQEMKTPLCELKRCGIYSQWLELPWSLCLMIAEYANHHATVTTGLQFETPIHYDAQKYVRVMPQCWCQEALLAQIKFGRHSLDLTHWPMSDSVWMDTDTWIQFDVCDRPFSLRVMCDSDLFQFLEDLVDWHNDEEWPGIDTEWLKEINDPVELT